MMTEKPNLPKFYKEVEVPEYWTLTDLLYWASARVLPTPMYFDEDEGRDSLEAFQQYPLSLGSELGPEYLNPSETSRLVIGNDPRWNYYERLMNDEEYVSSPEHHKMMAELYMKDDCTEEEKSERIQHHNKELKLYEKALEIAEYSDQWHLDLEDALDETICSLIVKLRGGKISATGIEVDINSEADFDHEIEKWFDNRNWDTDKFYYAHKPIPKSVWISRHVDWEGSYIRNGKKAYLAIRYDSDDVINLFPPIKSKPIQLERSGEYLFGYGGNSNPIRKAKKIGRPSKNSEAIHRKIASVIANEGGLIMKQDAFAHTIIQWYEAEFVENIGVSTVKAKLSGYYNDPAFKKSEK
ncbi:hypothetical protein [Hellea balneolensis]|uniref:hypothetical protein n=1 Tax=Hellea balneolensis TaxID=287478 RepID=UPI00047B3F72|nr:hypothetical protein [Hellea balneolensis]